jgi:kynureninase
MELSSIHGTFLLPPATLDSRETVHRSAGRSDHSRGRYRQAVDSTTRAAALDAADPLAGHRNAFHRGDEDLVYFDGNSLGRPPRRTLERLAAVARDEWAGELIRAWDHWLDLPLEVGELIGTRILGARPGEVVVADSTTVNLYRLAAAALDARPGRRTLVVPRDEFPTDRYILEGLAASRGLALRRLDGDPIEGLTIEAVAAALHDDVALLLLSHVNYRSAAIAPLAEITALAREAGALVVWDLSHSAGVLETDLAAAGADLAVGCTYKYLCGGPGAPAFLYVRRELQDELRPPIQGWFAQADQVEMGPAFARRAGIGGWLVGTPGILGLTGTAAGAELVAEAGVAAIRAKATALTDFAIELHDAWLAPLGVELGSPRERERRGGHVSLRHPSARHLCSALFARGVIPDFRAPDSIRIGLSPLSTSFNDVRRGLDTLRELLTS